MFWHPTCLEIEGQFGLKLREFAETENQNPKLSMGNLLDRYIHNDPHEWFFYEFHIILYEWLAKSASKKKNFQGGEPTSWTPELIQELQETYNKASWAIEVWLDSILEGYITEFVVDTNKSFSEAERDFFNGPRGRFFMSLQLSIKQLVCEKGILKMDQEQWNSGVRRMQELRQKGGDTWKGKGQMDMSFGESVKVL